MDAKKNAAERAVEYVQHGMTIGLGTGTTAYWAVLKLGQKIREGLHVNAVATSVGTEKLAKENNIPIAPFSEIDSIDLAIDGADEVDRQKNLIKGGGGALTREKIIAYNSRKFIVVVDESKLVEQLGKFPLPVEVLPFGAELTLKRILSMGVEATIRQAENSNYITDNGNLIVDCRFGSITDPSSLDAALKTIPGIVETGIFLNTRVSTVVVGFKTGDVNEL
ncbi:ribose-5-phosphate isomerase RpiA [Flavisolibacter ginsenosidimutans]|uniref:Ribose-5-phosphate isomerase A n=1 Tax=Flavisolibacter ginsenosidimutans TaxID=661481 RepID=A0A5B8UIQ8_9BACT|nr:ribose-5-phosphate isomerase RpiA [Flavisolibacter ginsenosidimutans]QEC56276.1 ribose-5-phosphate isomerase RpiA [Flavisolibacter ginsenosidimutans]